MKQSIPPPLRVRQLGWLFVVVLMLTRFVSAPVTYAQGDDPAPLVVPPGEVVDGSVATVERSIRVEGHVTGDVTSWSGDIVILGRVDGDVVSYAGQITIAPEAHIGGSVLALAGGVQAGPGAQIAGQLLGGTAERGALASVFDLLSDDDQPASPLDEVRQAVFGLIVTIFLFAFSLLWLALWPRRSAAAALVLRRMPIRSIVVGVLTTLLLAVLAPLAIVLLAATLIGAPLIVFVLLVLLAPYIYGIAVAGRALAQHTLLPRVPGIDRVVVGAIAVLATVVGLVTALAPLSGLVVFVVLGSAGLGAAILSRGGMALPRGVAPVAPR